MKTKDTGNQGMPKDISSSRNQSSDKKSSQDTFHKSLYGLGSKSYDEAKKSKVKIDSNDESVLANIHPSIIEAIKLKREKTNMEVNSKLGKMREKNTIEMERKSKSFNEAMLSGVRYPIIDAIRSKSTILDRETKNKIDKVIKKAGDESRRESLDKTISYDIPFGVIDASKADKKASESETSDRRWSINIKWPEKR